MWIEWQPQGRVFFGASPPVADTLFPVVQVFPDRGKFFQSLHRIAR